MLNPTQFMDPVHLRFSRRPGRFVPALLIASFLFLPLFAEEEKKEKSEEKDKEEETETIEDVL